MRDLIKVMKALSDPGRVKMLKLLQLRTLCVCELQAALGLSQPNISKHLRVLQEAGLVDSRKEGLWVNYYTPEESANPYAAESLERLKGWLEEDPEMRELLVRLPEIHRENLPNKIADALTQFPPENVAVD
jgi:ArsR family transcriptional regulator